MKDETMWLRGILRDRKSDAFSRLASIGNGYGGSIFHKNNLKSVNKGSLWDALT